MSEGLIFAPTNPQYDDRLFIELQVQYMKISSSEHAVYTNAEMCQLCYIHTKKKLEIEKGKPRMGDSQTSTKLWDCI